MGIKDQKDPRDRIHHGGWTAKIVCWCFLVFLMFFVPNGVVSFYGGSSPAPSSPYLLCENICMVLQTQMAC